MKQNKLYAVFKEGVYRHECAGIFDSLDKANSVAKEWADTDEDYYHSYNVYPFQLNETTSREILYTEMYCRPRRLDSIEIYEPDRVSSFRKGETNHD